MSETQLAEPARCTKIWHQEGDMRTNAPGAWGPELLWYVRLPMNRCDLHGVAAAGLLERISHYE